ncbi:MAG: hypothetical protein J5I93_20985 [Pirellulaceae bacterium]|nr:hypothetical protein [Pirellulaceae bacterium]
MTSVRRLWSDEAGFVVSTELAIIATILVIGMIVGLTTIRDQVVQELADVAGMISQLNQSYSFSAITGHHSTTAGSFGIDRVDSCDQICGDIGCNGAVCVDVCSVHASHESP